MERRLQGINPGAGISRFSAAMVRQYGLDQAGYHVEPGSEEDCFGAFERAVADGKWIVVPLWHPHYLHYRHGIRPLRDPLGLLGGEDAATLLMRHDAAAKLRPQLIAELQDLTIGNEGITKLDHQIRVENKSPDQAARHWLVDCARTAASAA